jgi:hypothetical protein
MFVAGSVFIFGVLIAFFTGIAFEKMRVRGVFGKLWKGLQWLGKHVLPWIVKIFSMIGIGIAKLFGGKKNHDNKTS